jgi:hypothetical protein
VEQFEIIRIRIVRVMRYPSFKSRAANFLLVAGLCGCNAILGNESATFAGDGAESGHGGESAGAAGKGGSGGRGGSSGMAGVAFGGSAGVESGEGGEESGGTASGGETQGAAGGESAGGGAGGADDGMGGEGGAATGCNPGCEVPTPVCELGVCVECALDAPPRCGEAQTPEVCVAGVWTPSAQCATESQVCSNGVCVGRYLFGALVDVGVAPGGATMKVVDHGFESGTALACRANACVTGGIRP